MGNTLSVGTRAGVVQRWAWQSDVESGGVLVLAAISGCFTAVMVVLAFIGAATHHLADLEVYLAGGSAVLHGHPLYDVAAPLTGLPFTYPPVAGVLAVPLSLIPRIPAQLLWTAANLDRPRRTACDRRTGGSARACPVEALADRGSSPRPHVGARAGSPCGGAGTGRRLSHSGRPARSDPFAAPRRRPVKDTGHRARCRRRGQAHSAVVGLALLAHRPPPRRDLQRPRRRRRPP